MMNNKEKIIHEAQKLFSLNGFCSTGVDEIIKAAGTSKGGFYNHFSSKEDLFYEVLAESQKIWRDKVFNSINEIESPTGKIIQMLKNYRDRYLKDAENFPGGCIFITFSVELNDSHPHLVKKVHQGFEGLKALLKRHLEEAVEIGELPSDMNTTTVTEMLMTGMMGASVLFGVDKSPATINSSIDSLIDYIYLLSDKQVINHVQ
jgi:AcrR family transcriptional regulator